MRPRCLRFQKPSLLVQILLMNCWVAEQLHDPSRHSNPRASLHEPWYEQVWAKPSFWAKFVFLVIMNWLWFRKRTCTDPDSRVYHTIVRWRTWPKDTSISSLSRPNQLARCIHCCLCKLWNILWPRLNIAKISSWSQSLEDSTCHSPHLRPSKTFETEQRQALFKHERPADWLHSPRALHDSA